LGIVTGHSEFPQYHWEVSCQFHASQQYIAISNSVEHWRST